jgi:hypothetical protein
MNNDDGDGERKEVDNLRKIFKKERKNNEMNGQTARQGKKVNSYQLAAVFKSWFFRRHCFKKWKTRKI